MNEATGKNGYNLIENTYGSDAKILLDRFYSLNQSGRNELIKYLEYVSSQDQYKKRIIQRKDNIIMVDFS